MAGGKMPTESTKYDSQGLTETGAATKEPE